MLFTQGGNKMTGKAYGIKLIKTYKRLIKDLFLKQNAATPLVQRTQQSGIWLRDSLLHFNHSADAPVLTECDSRESVSCHMACITCLQYLEQF